jgi:hypothetical protein
MVFLIQQSQNKDALAVHLKLNELLASHREASNTGIDRGPRRGRTAPAGGVLPASGVAGRRGRRREMSHSFDEANQNHAEKTSATYAKIGAPRAG